MAVFYQKYRPQRFADVIGQESIVQTLKNAAQAQSLAHAYLFTGSRGVGKTTLARLLAKAANCQTLQKGDPCGACEVCTAIANGTSLDIIEIDAASHTGVDNVREFIEHAQFRPTSMTRKVFIIDEVHMLSKAAFNALLKTLEEPPEHVMFILATTDIEKVPATIASRTQRFDFKRINPQQMTDALNEIAKDQKLQLPDGVIEVVVAQSEGSMRDALTRLDMVASLGEKISLSDAEVLLGVTPIAMIQDLVGMIISHNSAALPDFFETSLAKGTDSTVFNRGVLVYLRQLLGAKLTGNTPADFQSDAIFAQQLAQITLPQLLFTIRLFLRSYKELSSAPSPELPMLLAAIEASMQGVVAQTSQTSAQALVQPAPAKPVQQPQVQTESTVEVVETIETVTKITAKTESLDPEDPEEAERESTGYKPDTVTMSELEQWWPDVISRVRTENSPVATLLKNSPVVDCENGKIIVAVKYLFHKEHLDNKKHSSLIAEAIKAVCGKNLQLKSVIKNHTMTPITNTVDALGDALKVFGGELVE
jgi:DNA polymerase III subunit gamma/tau